MYVLIGILILVILILVACLWNYQRQVKNICRQLAFLKEHDSNMLISGETDYGGIGTLVDILNEFLAMRKKEKKRYLEKEKMIADTYINLSHDIRTPLTSLDGYFQLLGDNSNPEDQKRYLGIIQERIQSLNHMLEELFTFTKLKNEAYHLELSDCCMNRILKDTIFSYYEEWMEQGIVPEFHITEELFYIKGNPQALGRVIRNIVKNGLDHGEKKISVSLQKIGNRVCMEINNQVANPEEIDAGQVFDRFYKADKARSKTSTGLGLSIAKEFVLRMNGEIEAEVREKEFCVRISFMLLEKNR